MTTEPGYRVMCEHDGHLDIQAKNLTEYEALEMIRELQNNENSERFYYFPEMYYILEKEEKK